MSDAADLSKGASDAGVADKAGSATTGSTLPGWTAGLSKEQKEAITSQKMVLPEKITEFWDRHTQLEANLKGAVIVPRKEDPPEVWSNYRKAIGVPDSKDGYSFDEPKLPEGMVYDKGLKESFAQWAHDEGLSVATAKNLFNKFTALNIERSKGLREQQAQAKAEADATRVRDLDTVRTELRRQWGETFDARMPRNMAALQNPVMMPQSIVEKLDKSGILRDPAFHLWWDKQVSMMSSDRKLGLNREQGEGLEEEENKTPPGRLPENMFKKTAERFPKRKKAG